MSTTRPHIFKDRKIDYIDFRYTKNKSNIGRLGFIVYYISIVIAFIITFTDYNTPLIAGTILIISFIALMLVANYSKFDVRSLFIALISGLISIILLFNINSNKILRTIVLSIYLLSSAYTVYTAELKQIISLVK